MNRYPHRGTVSMNLGLAEESPSASRALLTAVANPCSKSTKVPDGQRSCWSSSRVRICPGRCSNSASTRNGWDCSLSLIPFRRNSLAPRSASNDPKRKTPFWTGIYPVLSPLDLTAPFRHLNQARNLLRTSEISVELYLNREPDPVHG